MIKMAPRSAGRLLAAALSVLAGIASLIVAERVYEQMPHIEDEIAIVWQAETIASGSLTIPSPPYHEHFLIPFVVDYQGQRFGKYPLGWPALLSLGVRLGGRALVNPLLAALGVWLTYSLGRRLMSETVAVLAAGLTLVSPFFLMNSGSLLSHPLGLVLSAGVAIMWLDARNPALSPRWRWVASLGTAFCLGLLALTRPLTAVGVGLPFGLAGLCRFWRGDRQIRRQLLAMGLVVLGLAALHSLWQYAVTGDPLLNPYTLWWPYDRIGFGPGIGRVEGGHNLSLALLNTRFSLQGGARDLFGWGAFSWIFLPFGLWAVRRNRAALLVGSVFFALVGIYLLYWVGSWVYGPRYFFEGLYALTLLSAAGIAFLAGWPLKPGERFAGFGGRRMLRPLGMTALLAILISASLLFYIPTRLGGMRGLNGFSRSHLEPFQAASAQALTPALVIVHPEFWTAYGTLLELEDPFLTTPFIFALSRGPRTDGELAATTSRRNVYHYYPDEPYVFYLSARE